MKHPALFYSCVNNYAKTILPSASLIFPSLSNHPAPRITSSLLMFAAFAISATLRAFSAA